MPANPRDIFQAMTTEQLTAAVAELKRTRQREMTYHLRAGVEVLKRADALRLAKEVLKERT